MSKIFFIMGKSASGKDGVFSQILNKNIPGLKPVTIYTTRPMRDGEVQGREYNFTDEDGLCEMRGKGLVIEERVYHTVQGDWIYFTAADDTIGDIKRVKHPQTAETQDDGSSDPDNYIVINTLEAYEKYLDYFGEEVMVPVYIYVDDDIRLIRAVERERQQKNPDYKEVCRRFLADEDDFSEKKLTELHIDSGHRFHNNGPIGDTVSKVEEFIRKIAVR